MADEGPYRSNCFVTPPTRKRWTIVGGDDSGATGTMVVVAWWLWSIGVVINGLSHLVVRALIACIAWTLIYAVAFVRRVER